jgi:hypothetical protein
VTMLQSRVAETSNVGSPTRGRTSNANAQPQYRNATTDGSSLHRERAPHA